MELKGGYDNLLKGNNSLKKQHMMQQPLMNQEIWDLTLQIFWNLQGIGLNWKKSSRNIPQTRSEWRNCWFLPWFLQYIYNIYIYSQTINFMWMTTSISTPLYTSLSFHVKKLHVELLESWLSWWISEVPPTLPPTQQKVNMSPQQRDYFKRNFHVPCSKHWFSRDMLLLGGVMIIHQLLIHWSFWLLVESFKQFSPGRIIGFTATLCVSLVWTN